MAIGNTGIAARMAKDHSDANPFKTFLSRYFYFCMALIMPALVIWGFSRTVEHNLIHASPPRPLLLWMHGAAFSTWMVFYAAQSGLVRVRKVAVHRLLGWFGLALATAMVILGSTVALVMTRFDINVLHQQGAETFLTVPFCDMIVFGACVGMAIYWRKKPELHRRLLFIATCELMDAAVGRFDFVFNHNLFYPILDGLILLGMLRDWIVEGRVHKIYLYVLPPMILLQAIAVYAWRANPAWWQTIAHALIAW